jgi:predicted Zn-dependent protease
MIDKIFKYLTLGLFSGFLFLSSAIISSCTTEDNEIESSLDGKSVGVSANALLSSDRFDKLVIEVLYVEGYIPTQQTLDSMLTFLGRNVNKPEGMDIVMTEVTSPKLPSYTMNDIRVIESQNRTEYTFGNKIAVCIFFSDEDFSENLDSSKTFGLAYANSSIVIFQKTIYSYSDQSFEPDRDLLERSVVNHELGHLLGLVNEGSEMQNPHQDEAHGKHCDNDSCIMNWVVETNSFADKLFGMTQIPEFDQNCLNDLKANGGK